MLPRQRLVDLRQRKSLGLDLQLRFGDAHLVFQADRNRRIFFAILQQHQPAVRLERGPQVAQRLSVLRPDMKILYISGYPGGNVRDHADGGAGFLEKPFTPEILVSRVRDALDSAPGEEELYDGPQ